MATRRVTMREAADVLGVSKEAIRKRVIRGTLRSETGEDGRRYVYLDTDTDEAPTHERDALISELHSRIESLENIVATRNEELARRDTIIMNMTEAMKALNPPPSRPGPTPQTPHNEGPATRYAAAIALMGIVLAAGLGLLTGKGFWDQWAMLIGALLLLVLWSVPLDWIGTRIGRYTVWPAAFALCLYAALAYPFAWVLSTFFDSFFDSRKDADSVQKTDAFGYGGMAMLIVILVLGVGIAYWRTHRATAGPQEAAQPRSSTPW